MGYTGEEMAEQLSKFVNKLGNNKDEQEFCAALMRQHRTLQQSVFSLMTAAIKEWSKQQNFDARNEFTVATCKEIVDKVDAMKYSVPLI